MLVFLGEQGVGEEIRTFAVGIGKCVDDVDDVDGHPCGGSSDCAIHGVSHDSQLQPAIQERENLQYTDKKDGDDAQSLAGRHVQRPNLGNW